MGLIWVIVIGFLVGTVAKVLIPGGSREPVGFFLTTLLGIAGSWVGGWLFGILGFSRSVGFIGSVIGAVVILLVYRWLDGRKT